MKSNPDRLLEAALDLFSSRGYSAVGVQEIVDAVSLSKPTLYYYFESKKGLLEAVLKWGTSSYLQSLQVAARYEHNLTGTLHQIAQVTFNFAKENPVFYQFWSALNFAPGESEEALCAQPIYLTIRKQISKVFEMAVIDHGNLAGKSEIVTENFIGILAFLAHKIADQKLVVDGNTLYTILHLFEHGIYS